MENRNDPPHQDYSPVQKMSHWGLAFLCVLAFPTAWAFQQAQIGRVFGLRISEFDLFLGATHEWVGWLALFPAVFLLFGRVTRSAPPLPTGMRLWQRVIAYSAHTAIYLCVFALVVSGAAATYVDGSFGVLHVQLTKIGIGLLALHLAAVVWHQMIRHDNLLMRLLPTRTRHRAAVKRDARHPTGNLEP